MTPPTFPRQSRNPEPPFPMGDGQYAEWLEARDYARRTPFWWRRLRAIWWMVVHEHRWPW